MPELPEVETLKRQLDPLVVGQRIRGIEFLDGKLGVAPDLTGLLITGVCRRGKELFLLLGGGLTLKIHLRMSGRLLWQEPGSALPRHSRAAWHLDTGRIILVDPRRFAVVTVADNCLPGIYRTEEESPWLPSAAKLALRACSRRRPVKAFLLDQAVIPGMGNIYVCETLFQAKIDPRRPAGKITPQEWEKIHAAAGEILTQAVGLRGTSISDWRDLFGAKGENQERLNVYGRKGAPCVKCKAPIVRIEIGGRGTFFCPYCQEG